MIINNKEINIDDIIDEIDINNNVPKLRNNGLILRDSQIEILKKYNINYENYSSLSSLIFEIEEILTYETDLDDLEELSIELSEQNYYNNTNK